LIKIIRQVSTDRISHIQSNYNLVILNNEFDRKNEKQETVMNDVFTQWPGAFITSSITKTVKKL